MRVNNLSPNTTIESNVTRTAQQPSARPAESAEVVYQSDAWSMFQGTAARPAARRAEEGIGSSLRASQLRTAAQPSLESVVKNATDQLGPIVTKTATPNAAIRDFQTTTSTIDITDAGQIADLKVNVNIAHTYRGDLVVKLTSPSGKEVTLHNRTGGSADNLTFEVDRSEFDGQEMKGQWKLTVQDAARADQGTLRSWGLKIEKKADPTPTPTPTGPTNLQVIGDANFRARVAADLAKFAPGTTVDAQGFVHEATTKTAGHDNGYTIINRLLNSTKGKVTINFTANNAFAQSGAGATGTVSNPNVGAGSSVFYDPNLNIALPTLNADGTITDQGISSEVVLAHELIHAMHASEGTIDRSNRTRTFTDGNKTYSETWRFEEFRTTGFQGFRQGLEPSENAIRAELGYKPRATYVGRSGWTLVNGVAPTQNTTGNEALANNGWSGGRICGCFGCGGGEASAA